jgi:hypothetical protein
VTPRRTPRRLTSARRLKTKVAVINSAG